MYDRYLCIKSIAFRIPLSECPSLGKCLDKRLGAVTLKAISHIIAKATKVMVKLLCI